MDEEVVLDELIQFFDVREFVGRRTYKKYGQRAWKFVCPRLRETMLILRQNLDMPIHGNDWYKRGKFSQRGLRTNLQELFRNKFRRGVLYISSHVLGKGFDFHVNGMTAEEVRDWIIANQHLFPYKIRLEHLKNGKPIPWVHIDVIYEVHNPKVYLFNV